MTTAMGVCIYFVKKKKTILGTTCAKAVIRTISSSRDILVY